MNLVLKTNKEAAVILPRQIEDETLNKPASFKDDPYKRNSNIKYDAIVCGCETDGVSIELKRSLKVDELNDKSSGSYKIEMVDCELIEILATVSSTPWRTLSNSNTLGVNQTCFSEYDFFYFLRDNNYRLVMVNSDSAKCSQHFYVMNKQKEIIFSADSIKEVFSKCNILTNGKNAENDLD